MTPGVNELHKVLVLQCGLFAAGKFDQYKRDIPYATLAQAFQSLVRPLLARSNSELSGWRDAFLEALGPNGQLMVDLVPELELIIGEQPPAPPLEPQQARGRFQRVFRRFIGVFARPEHPLALFLDDLQWLDAATIDLLEDLLTQSDVQHLMLIGAYRDNEVTAAHPLKRKLDTVLIAGGKVTQITLSPLARAHVGQLIADALRCDLARAAPLAHLVHEKTGGNPLFAIQFISSLADEGILAFDHDAACWSWDLDRIHAKGYTDNVVDLMLGKLDRLPADTQKALQQLACLGNIAELTTLSLVLGVSEEKIHAQLWPAVRQEFAERLAGAYRFVHDRVQEAAYSLIPDELRAEAHLRIGRLLAVHTPPEKREEAIFDIVNQFNRAAPLITSHDERGQLAELNLLAGKRAKASAAYASALTYVTAGAAQLEDDCWQRQYELAFALEYHRAECELLTGDLAAAEQRLSLLACRARSLAHRAMVTCLRIELFVTLDRRDRSIEVGLEYLRYVDVTWSSHPTQEEVRQEFDRIWNQLGSHSIEGLIDAPLMHDAGWQATMDVLTMLLPAALFTDEHLFCLTVAHMANVSLEQGHTDGSCLAYVWLGLLLGPYFGNYRAAFAFGQLGLDLVEKRGLDRFRARVYLDFSHVVNPWMQHARVGPPLVRRAFDVAHEGGDLTFASYSSCNLVSALLAAGEILSDVQREAEKHLEFVRKVRFGLIVDIIAGQLRLILALRGLTPSFSSFNGPDFDESRFERHLDEDPGMAVAIGWYWVRKLQGRFLADAPRSAVEAAAKVEQVLWTMPSHLEVAEYHFYAALARAAYYAMAPADDRPPLLRAIRAHHEQLALWAEHCPENFENRAALVGAEIARLEGRELDAERLYERAIRSARASGFVHHEALANELAGRFYAARGFEKFAHVCLKDARHCYLRWGATGKVKQLDALYPHLSDEEPVPGPTSTIGAPVEHLDLATVIKMSQAVSGEIVLEKLIDTLMRTAIEQAGAERGLLVLVREGEPRIKAEATIDGDTLVVQVRDKPVTSEMVPNPMLHYVMRTRESVILDDAVNQDPFDTDAYVRQHRVRSALCMPLINRGQLIGVLYLENNLTPRVFVSARIAVLKLLASQAAMTLENARLYRDLAEREARIRRLVDANIVGIFIWDLEGRIPEANDAFLRMVGYSREDLASGRVHRTRLTPPEWRDRDARTVLELKQAGTVQPFEKEYFRKDGSRVPVLIGFAAFDEQRDQGVAFVLDLTERKRAEAEARESEQRLREVQMALAHANRVTTMGQLAASIAHEIKQPIAANVANAQAGLRWLQNRPPDLEEVGQSFDRIIKDAMRASQVTNRIHGLVKNAPPCKQTLQINEAIDEVIAMTRLEAEKNSVSLWTRLSEDLPLVEGDRVQLQQVVLNLILNAMEAMSAMAEGPRELSISTDIDESGSALIAVRDSGPGISPENFERIFEPFYTSKAGGMGMGLSICRSIAEAHGGRLWVNANVPRGAAFHFAVPAHPSTAR